jgi:hypothetical protein
MSSSTYIYIAHIHTYVVLLFMAAIYVVIFTVSQIYVVSLLDPNFITTYVFKALAFSERNLYFYMTTK